MIVRNLKGKKNNDSHSSFIFPYYIDRKTYNLFDHLEGNSYTGKNDFHS